MYILKYFSKYIIQQSRKYIPNCSHNRLFSHTPPTPRNTPHPVTSPTHPPHPTSNTQLRRVFCAKYFHLFISLMLTRISSSPPSTRWRMHPVLFLFRHFPCFPFAWEDKESLWKFPFNFCFESRGYFISVS